MQLIDLKTDGWGLQQLGLLLCNIPQIIWAWTHAHHGTQHVPAEPVKSGRRV